MQVFTHTLVMEQERGSEAVDGSPRNVTFPRQPIAGTDDLCCIAVSRVRHGVGGDLMSVLEKAAHQSCNCILHSHEKRCGDVATIGIFMPGDCPDRRLCHGRDCIINCNVDELRHVLRVQIGRRGVPRAKALGGPIVTGRSVTLRDFLLWRNGSVDFRAVTKPFVVAGPPSLQRGCCTCCASGIASSLCVARNS
eukprot:490575-Rhodomonas_salina.3